MRFSPLLYALHVAVCAVLVPHTIAKHSSEESHEHSKLLFSATNSVAGLSESNRERHQHSYDSPYTPYENPYPYPPPAGTGLDIYYQYGPLHFNGGFTVPRGFVPGNYHNGPPQHSGGFPLPATVNGYHNGPNNAPFDLAPNSQRAHGNTVCPETGCPFKGKQKPDYPRPSVQQTDPALSGAGVIDVRSGSHGNFPSPNGHPEHRPPLPGYGVQGYYPAAGGPTNFPPYYYPPPPQYPRPPVAAADGGPPPAHRGVTGHSAVQYPNVDDHEHVQPSHDSHGGRGHSHLDHRLKSNVEYTETGHHVGPFQGYPSGYGYGSGYGGGYNGAFNRPVF